MSVELPPIQKSVENTTESDSTNSTFTAWQRAIEKSPTTEGGLMNPTHFPPTIEELASLIPEDKIILSASPATDQLHHLEEDIKRRLESRLDATVITRLRMALTMISSLLVLSSFNPSEVEAATNQTQTTNEQAEKSEQLESQETKDALSQIEQLPIFQELRQMGCSITITVDNQYIQHLNDKYETKILGLYKATSDTGGDIIICDQATASSTELLRTVRHELEHAKQDHLCKKFAAGDTTALQPWQYEYFTSVRMRPNGMVEHDDFHIGKELDAYFHDIESPFSKGEAIDFKRLEGFFFSYMQITFTDAYKQNKDVHAYVQSLINRVKEMTGYSLKEYMEKYLGGQ